MVLIRWDKIWMCEIKQARGKKMSGVSKVSLSITQACQFLDASMKAMDQAQSFGDNSAVHMDIVWEGGQKERIAGFNFRSSKVDKAYALGWRSPEDKLENDKMRNYFKASLCKLFGLTDKQTESKDWASNLPKSVQEVLKVDDFCGKGRPLSVRRIKAVMQLDEVSSKLEVEKPKAQCQQMLAERKFSVANPACFVAGDVKTLYFKGAVNVHGELGKIMEKAEGLDEGNPAKPLLHGFVRDELKAVKAFFQKGQNEVKFAAAKGLFWMTLLQMAYEGKVDKFKVVPNTASCVRWFDGGQPIYLEKWDDFSKVAEAQLKTLNELDLDTIDDAKMLAFLSNLKGEIEELAQRP